MGVESDKELVSQVESVAGCIKRLNIFAGCINFTDGNITPSYQRSIQTWVSYIGKKYSNVEYFEIRGLALSDHPLLWNNNAFEKRLVGAVQQLKHVNTYRVPCMTCGIIQTLQIMMST